MFRSLSRQLSIFVREPTRSPWIRRPESLQEVVVCLDPKSSKSEAVFQSACRVVSRTKGEAEVRAIHVPRSKNWRDDPSVGDMLRYAAVFSPPQTSVDMDVIESQQSVKRTIVAELVNKNPDLCVIGASTSIFSTVQYVLKNSPCDVLVVRDDGLTGLTNGEPMKAIVCFGINDWEGSRDAFRAALRIARPGDKIEAVHVVYAGGPVDAVFGPPMIVPPGNGTTEEKIAKAIEKAMLETLDDKATSVSRNDVEIKPTVLYAGIDNPVKILVDHADKVQANLLSVGAGRVGRALSPVNFSYQLTRKSPCSVLVAKKTKNTDSQKVSNNKRSAYHPSFYVEDPQKWVETKSFI